MNTAIAVTLIVIALLALLTATVRAYLPDTYPYKHPLRYRAERRRAWQEAASYGRVYGPGGR